MTGDGRYTWLNDAACVVSGEVRRDEDGGFDVAELVWEPLK